MRLTYLAAALMAAGFGIGAATAQSDQDNLREDQLGRAEAGTDTSQSSAEQAEIPAQSLDSVGSPEQAQTTGQGQGVLESNSAEPLQPNVQQIPEQSLGATGHPQQADTTGQGEGVADQPASAEAEGDWQQEGANRSGEMDGEQGSQQ
ncbi:MAG: hypothetical protein KIS79_15915 [Burkholderiales bacterium]|nr:hypothetical protein [Burkholderiales bacterium]